MQATILWKVYKSFFFSADGKFGTIFFSDGRRKTNDEGERKDATRNGVG